jgi:hypothetical protein
MSRQFDGPGTSSLGQVLNRNSELQIQRFAGISDCDVSVDFANLTIGLAQETDRQFSS